jgi:Bifunctional DNA primase/polymerase, N-terminal/AAA domain
MSKKRSEHRQSQHKGNGKSPESASKASLALRYAEAGIPVVPLHGTREGCCACGDRHCKRPGKHPRTTLGIADAAIDIQDIKRMWNNWPNAKIGMVMGWPGKLLALATDGDAGRQTLQAITATRGKLPRTVTIRDHDRRFRLFRVDGNPPHSRDIGEGVRILGDGELIVAPSTLSGFARDRAPGQVKIAKTPRWLVEIRATSSSDRVACESEPRPAQSKQVRLPSNDGDGDSRLVVTRAIDVTRTDVTWLWPGRIALGKVSVIAGNPGLGKSQLAAFLAATVSTGREWPCREGQAPLGDAIMLTAEDDAGDTVIPRLEVANADLSRIHFVNINNSGRTFDLLLDVQKLEQEIRRLGDIRLIIIDPITAFLKSTGMLSRLVCSSSLQIWAQR